MLAGGGSPWSPLTLGLAALIEKYEAGHGKGGAAPSREFLEEARTIMRSCASDFEANQWVVLRDIALRMHDLVLNWPEDEAAADVRHLSLKLMEQCLQKAPASGGEGEARDEKLEFNLLESLVHTGKAYKECGQLLKALAVFARARDRIVQHLQRPKTGGRDFEKLQLLECEVIYHKIELLVALDGVAEYGGKSKEAVAEAHAIIEDKKLPPSFSRKFGTLCYNLSVRCVQESQKPEGTDPESIKEALFWSEQAARFFSGPTCHAEHASSKSLSAKARIAAGHLDDALQDLKVANMLSPTPRSQLLELQCLVLMKRFEEANVFLQTHISEVGWKACSGGLDEKKKCLHAWFRMAMIIAEANQADIANETWARVVALVKNDADPSVYEEAQLNWISALACTCMRDLSLCALQIDALSARHAQTACQPLTQKKILVVIAKIIEELDAAGSLKKAIEWRQKALPWAQEEDQVALSKQIVRIALRVGAIDVAEQYLVRCQPKDSTAKVPVEMHMLKFQVMVKAAEPGDDTPERAKKHIEEIFSYRSKNALSPAETVDILDSACKEAHAAGYADCAKRCLRGFIQEIVAAPPADFPDVFPDRVFLNMLLLLVHHSEKGEVELVRGASIEDVPQVLGEAAAYITKNGFAAFGRDERSVETLNVLGDVAWNTALMINCTFPDAKLASEMAAPAQSQPTGGSSASQAPTPVKGAEYKDEYEQMGSLYEMSANFRLLHAQHTQKEGGMQEGVAMACISLYLSAVCKLLHVQRGGGQNKRPLQLALDTVGRLREIRKQHNMPASALSSINEARLEFELACLLRRPEPALHALAATYAQELVPRLEDRQARLNNLIAMCQVCSKAKAPHAVTGLICAAALQLQPEPRAPADVAIMADIHMLRIVRAYEESNAPLAMFEEVFEAVRKHPAEYPPEHVHEAAIMAYNSGDLHLHWERLQPAEQWIGMAVKLAKECSTMSEGNKQRLNDAYIACLGALRA